MDGDDLLRGTLKGAFFHMAFILFNSELTDGNIRKVSF